MTQALNLSFPTVITSGTALVSAGLLIGGIRSAGFATLGEKLRPLIVNSLLETNLGMPYIYAIFIAYTRRFTEQMKRREEPLAFTERIAENNGERVREK